MSFLTPVWSYVDALVHPTAQHDALTAARHRVFMVPKLLGSFAALASFPAYLTLRGVPSALEVGVFSWLVVPLLIVYYLSRTGRFESAHVLSSLSLTGLTFLVALCTGGIGSFAAVWLLVVPLEAALSASRRVVTLATIFVLSAAGLLLVLGAAKLLPQPVTSAEHQSMLAAIGVVTATIYAAGLAFGVALLARTSVSLLQVEEDRNCLLAYAMTDVIVRHGRNGSVLSVSPAAEALIGVQANQLLGAGVFDQVHIADRPAYLAAIADAATLNEERIVEVRIRCGAGVQHAGQFVWIEMRCRPRGSNANEREVVAVLRDIGERKSQEHAIEIARLESRRASAAKSHFAATMSHKLRTPLNVIIGLSDMLTNESLKLGSGRRLEYAKLINDSGRHLLFVINGILDVSKMETGNLEITPQPFAPAREIESCTDLLALKAQEAGVELSMRIGPDLPEVTADRRAFNQILINLISNAVKFTPHGGRVTVSALRDGPKLAVTVEDTGIGIGDTDLSRLGEVFFQARASCNHRHDGSGIGLSIVKGLVHLHGGELDIQSRLGEGTRVTVRLPLECEGGRGADHPAKLVNKRNRSFPMATNDWVKKSA